jgi:malonate-semialdehyde dehydrogenase (acetylating)/methylmalonate-semialdehyde dehydrogenase
VAGHLEGAVAEGATLAIDGRKDPAMAAGGFFLGPSLIDNARPGMRCYDHEIFGPVLSVVRVPT